VLCLGLGLGLRPQNVGLGLGLGLEGCGLGLGGCGLVNITVVVSCVTMTISHVIASAFRLCAEFLINTTHWLQNHLDGCIA